MYGCSALPTELSSVLIRASHEKLLGRSSKTAELSYANGQSFSLLDSLVISYMTCHAHTYDASYISCHVMSCHVYSYQQALRIAIVATCIALTWRQPPLPCILLSAFNWRLRIMSTVDPTFGQATWSQWIGRYLRL